MNNPIKKAIPVIATVGSLLAWGLTFLQLLAVGRETAGAHLFGIIAAAGLATLLTLFSRRDGTRFSSVPLWLSGGIWTGAAYVSSDVIVIAYFIVAILTIGSAATLESGRSGFSLSGPAVFILSAIFVSIALNLVT